MAIDQRERFMLRLAEALHAYGTPSHRLEEALVGMSRTLEVEAQYLVTPTSIVISFGSEPPRTHLLRVEPGETNLEKLTGLNDLMRRVSSGDLDAGDGLRELEALVEAPPRYPPSATVTAYALASSMAAILFGGGEMEILVTLVVGVLIGLLAVVAIGVPRIAGVYPALAAFVAAVLPATTDRFVVVVNPFVPTLAGLIVLIPGLSLTIAVSELAHRHLVSGTARLVGAVLTFLQIGLGVGVGWSLAGGVDGAAAPQPLGAAWNLLALALSVPAFVVLFRGRPRHAWTILAAALTAFGAARYGSAWGGPVVGAALGAFLLACVSNIAARWRHQPSAIGLLPGLLLLVPGSLGFRSMASLLSDDVLSAVDTAFTMGLIAVALVTGLLLANVVLPSRRWF